LDIVTGNSNNSFSFFKNISSPGAIAFAGNIDFSTGDPNSQPGGIVIADVDKDGRPDIITISYQEQTMSVFRNISSNGQVAFDTRIVYDLYGYPMDVSTADLDGDGMVDIALATTGGASVFRNTSVPGMISFAVRQDLATGGSWPNGAKLVDVDGDGKLDLVVVNINSNQLTFFRNISTPGAVTFGTAINVATGNGPWTVLAGDLDGDGKPDLITPNIYNTGYFNGITAISVFQNGGSPGNIILQQPVSYQCSGPQYGGIADMDGDGKPDIVIWGGNLTIFRNEIGAPSPSFSPAVGYTGQTIAISGAGLNAASSVDLGGTPAQSFSITSDTSMTAVVGAGASGNVVIQLPNSDSILLPGFVYLPSPSVTSTGSTVLCTGLADTLLSSVASNNQWYRNGVLLANDTGSRLVVVDSGVYTVAGTFDTLVTPPSAGIDIIIIPIPAAPVISIDSGQLVSSADSGNQWYNDTTAIIAGAIGQYFTPHTWGPYSVRVTQEGCPSPFSVVYNYVPPPYVPPPVTTDSVQIVPNPFRTYISIEYNQSGPLTIEITNVNGNRILVEENVRNGDVIDLAWLPIGSYFIRITGDNGNVNLVRQILKL